MEIAIFIGGFVLGSLAGAVVTALMIAASISDRRSEENEGGQK